MRTPLVALLLIVLLLPGVSAYCNETTTYQYSGTNISNTTTNRTCTPEYNNYSFYGILITLLVLLVLSFIAFITFQGTMPKLISASTASFILLYITIFTSWFVRITNPEQIELIETVDRLNQYGVYGFKGMLYVGIFVIIVLGFKMIKEAASGRSQEDNE